MMDGGPVEVKVCIIGDSDVGKTSLSMRCVTAAAATTTTTTTTTTTGFVMCHVMSCRLDNYTFPEFAISLL
jgi:GTP-binding protein EngB required for normal cell division